MWVADMSRSIVGLWNSILLAVYRLLGTSPAQWGSGTSASGQVTSPWLASLTIQDALTGIGSGLALVFWCISFFRYIEEFHRIDVREVAGWILRFAVTIAILQMAPLIMEAILDLSLAVNAEIAATAGLRDLAAMDAAALEETGAILTEPRDILDAVDAVNRGGNVLEQIGAFFEALPLSLIYFLLWAVILGCGILIIVTLFMRFFKLYLYTALSPLPLATLAGSATGEMGKHFLKSWAGVCLELCVITIAVLIFASSMHDTANILPFLGDGQGESTAQNLWSTAMNWVIQVLIKSVLLVSAVRGADQITGRMLGT